MGQNLNALTKYLQGFLNMQILILVEKKRKEEKIHGNPSKIMLQL